MSPSDNIKETRPRYWVYLLPLGIFSALMLLFFIGLDLDPRLIPSPLINKPVPEFSLPRLRIPDTSFQHTDLYGKVSLFNVWATWCPSCKQEHPVLMRISKSDEIPLYGLYYKDDPASGIEWLKKYGDPYYANAIDPDGKVGIEWGVYGTPETFVVDQQGVIRYKHIGPITWKNWQTKLLPVIQSLRENSERPISSRE